MIMAARRKCQVATKRIGMREVLEAARECRDSLRTMVAVTPHYSFIHGCSESFNLTCSARDELRVCRSLEEAVAFFRALSGSPVPCDIPIPVHVTVGPDRGVGALIAQTVRCELVRHETTSGAGNGFVTEEWFDLRLSHDEINVDVTMVDYDPSYAWIDSSGNERTIRVFAQIRQVLYEADQQIAIYGISAEVQS